MFQNNPASWHQEIDHIWLACALVQMLICSSSIVDILLSPNLKRFEISLYARQVFYHVICSIQLPFPQLWELGLAQCILNNFSHPQLQDVRRGRGLVLMDPPYEPYDEYMAWNLYALRQGVRAGEDWSMFKSGFEACTLGIPQWIVFFLFHLSILSVTSLILTWYVSLKARLWTLNGSLAASSLRLSS